MPILSRVGSRFLAVAAATCTLLAAGCNDTDETPESVSNAAFEEEVVRLCNRHGAVLDEVTTRLDSETLSDADIVAFLRTDFVPRVRAVILGLAEFGFPADRATDLNENLNEAVAALDSLSADTYTWLDGVRRGDLEPGEDYLREALDALEEAGLGDC